MEYTRAMKAEETLTFIPLASSSAAADSASDLDFSFTSTASTSTTFTTSTTSSARSSLSLPSFHIPATTTPLPHSRHHPHWPSIRAAAALSPDSTLHLRHLSLLRPLGSGHLARVFHCRLRDSPDSPDFALKVVDLDSANPDHVRAEAAALSAVDHPFLPTLYARLDASHFACFLIDYCPNGDLHSLLSRRRNRRLPAPAARFYAAEVLLALQYLHALGFVYRDLKPENVLIQADGHVMLSDFDLSFQSNVHPSLLRRRRRRSAPAATSSCFPAAPTFIDEVQMLAEPVDAYSTECVGTHEYLAPEVVAGAGHGAGVDWWAFGVFLYELLYGTTPFKGATKEATLRNIAAARELKFPAGDGGGAEAAARDLIAMLLVRDPKKRLGAVAGAAEIQRHPFFDGVKWALMRCERPPVVSVAAAAGNRSSSENKRKGRGILGKILLGLGLGLGLGSSNNRKKSGL